MAIKQRIKSAINSPVHTVPFNKTATDCRAHGGPFRESYELQLDRQFHIIYQSAQINEAIMRS